MKIYTKTGDGGETSLFGGKRVAKDDLRIETYGTVDELNSVIGVCRAASPPPQIDTILQTLQNDLFTLGADLATPKNIPSASYPIQRITGDDIIRLERIIDEIESSLDPIAQFILPGGTNCGAQLHQARTVSRRAERRAVQLSRQERIGPEPVIYLNRLSDLLFVLARWSNALAGYVETHWKG